MIPAANSQEAEEAARILAAAREHVFKHGFRSLSLDALARKLGIPVKTIYAHYRTKQLLVTAALKQKLDELERDLEAIEREDGAFAEGVKKMTETLDGHFREYSKRYMSDIASTPALFEWRRKQLERILGTHATRLFKLGQREGVLRRDISAEAYNDIYLWLANGAFIDNILGKAKGKQAHDIHKTILAILHEGIIERCRDCQIRVWGEEGKKGGKGKKEGGSKG